MINNITFEGIICRNNIPFLVFSKNEKKVEIIIDNATQARIISVFNKYFQHGNHLVIRNNELDSD